MKRQLGPDITSAVISGIVVGSLVLFAVGAVALAREPRTKPISGASFTSVVVLTEDPTPWMAEGPTGTDPIGVKGQINGTWVPIDATAYECDDSECVTACERDLRNPFCTVISASCVPGERACYCTQFCARDGNGTQWTPTKEMESTVRGE
jgi:hypothetical protein